MYTVPGFQQKLLIRVILKLNIIRELYVTTPIQTRIELQCGESELIWDLGAYQVITVDVIILTVQRFKPIMFENNTGTLPSPKCCRPERTLSRV